MTTENNNNKFLTETVQETGLRVGISNHLKCEKQVFTASQQAMVVSHSVKRASTQFDRETFNIVYDTYILDHILNIAYKRGRLIIQNIFQCLRKCSLRQQNW